MSELKALAQRERLRPADRGQTDLFEQYTGVLRSLAARHPLLVILDDLQWADGASASLLFHLARRLPGHRILVVGAYRYSDVVLGRPAADAGNDLAHPLKPVVDELTRQFGHVLFQEYLYNRLSPGERRLLHGQVGRALEALCAQGLEAVTLLLAHHYAEAGEAEKAVHYLLQAGDRARTLYAHQEAIAHYRRALGFLTEMGDDERSARTYMKLGLAYNIAFDFERARQAYAEGFALWQRVEAAGPSAHLPSAPQSLRLFWLDPSLRDLDPTMGGVNLTAP